jgi:hypothetical protein
MPEQISIEDLIVVIPGITGSVLAVGDDQNEVWSRSGKAIMSAVRSLGRNADVLKLPRGFGATLPENEGEGEPADGVRATKLMADLHVIPGLWAPHKGYDNLIRKLKEWFTINTAIDGRPENLMLFPYDWRLSNVVSARRLAASVISALDHWRTHTGNADAKLILVCHSMGGLVARWFLEVLGGREVTRWLITIGTPYMGSVDALRAVIKGLSKNLGPLRIDLTELVRSFPSVYELLPTYPCVDVGDGTLRTLSEISGLGLDGEMLTSATCFHDKITQKIKEQSRRDYDTVAIKGVLQPTLQSLRWCGSDIEFLQRYGAVDKGGDGTVPRPSAHPPEWDGEAEGVTFWATQRHETLQDTQDVLAQLYGLLTSGRLGGFMGYGQLGIEIPDSLTVGEPVEVRATSTDPNLALTARVAPHDENDRVLRSTLLCQLREWALWRSFFEPSFRHLPN